MLYRFGSAEVTGSTPVISFIKKPYFKGVSGWFLQGEKLHKSSIFLLLATIWLPINYSKLCIREQKTISNSRIIGIT
jgi:hypothetical protein